MSAFFLGTCRMHDPAKVLRRAGHEIRSTPHRIHSLKQAYQVIMHLGGYDRYYSERNFHHLSDMAIRKVVRGEAETYFRRFDKLSKMWPKRKVIFIEISTLREYSIKRSKKHRFYVSTFSPRDLNKFSDEIAQLVEDGVIDRNNPPVETKLGEREAIRTMAQIKKYLPDRKIVWVSHMRPPEGNPAFAHVIESRKKTADILARGAEYLGDEFFDPSYVAKELGPEAFFKKNGQDLDHLTPEAATILAQRYFEIAKRLEPSLK